MAITICDLCAKRKICIDKNKFYPVVKCQNYHEGEAIKVEQTNEEYMRSCTTEQLVDAIFDCTMANSWNFSKDGIKRWLKQPHKPFS